ncbi:MAG: PAS domain-containing protein [Planctomycetota bacterium]|nr:PAS domain-containing protein [Planctomycetota bacterium]
MSRQQTNAEFEALLERLRQAHGFDFGAYKRSTLVRRIEHRMQSVGIRKFAAYADYLEAHPEEFPQLFNTILINVTGFFRDEAAWEYMAKEILPRILAGKKPDAPLRVWSAGCASGEEAYTLAILLAEAMGPDEFRRRTKIYATDIDEDALTQARQAVYSAKSAAAVPAALREKYFERAGDRYVFRADLRRLIIFGRHDILQDAPISRLDLLVCRNTIMYMNVEAQSRVLARFHFALRDEGALFLGKAEMLLSRSGLFTPLDVKHRIFAKVRDADTRAAMLAAAPGREEPQPIADQHSSLREAVFEATPTAHLVVDLDGTLALASKAASELFHLSPEDIGRPFRDLEISYRPVELRSVIEQVQTEHRPVKLTEVERRFPDGRVQFLNFEVAPLRDSTGNLLGAAVTVQDATLFRSIQEELQRSKQELETTNEELQSTNEELETTNEELQSTNEELETTNEELQSTNEEMETMNEELQSTNEELQTMNSELLQRTDALHDTNAFLQSVLAGLRAGVIAVNRDLNILAWNARATDLWGLTAEEVIGRPLLGLDIGLPVEELKKPIHAILSAAVDIKEISLAATTRRGKAITCNVTCTPRIGPAGDRQGVILLMEKAP